jgi:hypothetical protein
MKRLFFVAFLLSAVVAFADPAGTVHVKKGDEPAWLAVTGTVEQNRATYVIRINKDKGIDVDKHRFVLRFQVPEYEYHAFLIPVAFDQDKTGLATTFIVPVDVARKGSLYLAVESRDVKDGQASYVISMSNYIKGAEQATQDDGSKRAAP